MTRPAAAAGRNGEIGKWRNNLHEKFTEQFTRL